MMKFLFVLPLTLVSAACMGGPSRGEIEATTGYVSAVEGRPSDARCAQALALDQQLAQQDQTIVGGARASNNRVLSRCNGAEVGDSASSTER